MKVEFINLGSGSRGNCTWLESGDTCLLVDAGFSCRQLKERMLAAGKDPGRVNGILISHSHTDHTSGVIRFSKEYNVPVYCNKLTQADIGAQGLVPEFRIFNTGDSFQLGSIGVSTFRIQHDTSDPVGFVFQTGSIRLGVVTDLGQVTTVVREHLRGVYGILFESNHDIGLLRQCSRPWSTKQRIMSISGHLSNEQSAQGLREIAGDGLREVVLGHLSQECNRPDLALAVANESLGGGQINIRVASQKESIRILPEGFTV